MGEENQIQTELSTASDPEPEPQNLVSLAWEALRDVYDPELGIDIVALGLVYDIQYGDGAIKIEMTLTTPGCPASENLPAMAECAAVEALGPKADVQLHLVWDPPWDPTMMNTKGEIAPPAVMRSKPRALRVSGAL